MLKSVTVNNNPRWQRFFPMQNKTSIILWGWINIDIKPF